MNNEFGGITFLSQATLEGHEQILSYLNLENEEEEEEEEEFENTETSSSFDLASIDEDELYDEIVFAEDADSNDLLTASEMVALVESKKIDLLDSQLYFETGLYADDLDSPFGSDDEELAIHYAEKLQTVKKLSEMLLNKDEVAALQLQLTLEKGSQTNQAAKPHADVIITTSNNNTCSSSSSIATEKKTPLEAAAEKSPRKEDNGIKPEDLAYRPDYHQHYPHEYPEGYGLHLAQRATSSPPTNPLDEQNAAKLCPPTTEDDDAPCCLMNEEVIVGGERGFKYAFRGVEDLDEDDEDDESGADDESSDDDESDSEKDDDDDEHHLHRTASAPMKLRSRKSQSEEDVEIDIENVDDDETTNFLQKAMRKRSFSSIEEDNEDQERPRRGRKAQNKIVHRKQKRKLSPAPIAPTVVTTGLKRGPKPRGRKPNALINASSAPSSRASSRASRASSPAPIPVPLMVAPLPIPVSSSPLTPISVSAATIVNTATNTLSRVANFVANTDRKTTKIEETLIFRIKHLLPSDNLVAVIKAIQAASGPNLQKAVSSNKPDLELAEEFMIDLSYVPIPKLLSINELVSSFIATTTTTTIAPSSPSSSSSSSSTPSTPFLDASLSTPPSSPSPTTFASNPTTLQQHQNEPTNTAAAKSGPVTRTRNRLQCNSQNQPLGSSPTPIQQQKTLTRQHHHVVSDTELYPSSPLHVATSRPLVKSYSAYSTARTIKKQQEEASDEEIDIVGI